MSGEDIPIRAEPSPTQLVRSAAQEVRARRISYVMLFRLGVLLFATILAGISALGATTADPFFQGITWTTIALGFVLTILFARMLPRVERLESFAFLQTAIDLVLSATLVQLTGGIDSGFVFLYMVAVLGAALMGTRAQVWAAAGSAALIYTALASLQLGGLIEPLYPPEINPSRDPSELLFSIARTLGGIGAIGVLAAQLNVQLSRSGEELQNLKVLHQHIVQSLASGLVTIDPEGRIVLVNAQATRLLQRSRSELMRQSAQAIFPGLNDELVKKSREDHRFELTRTLEDGDARQLGCSLGPLRNGDGESLGWVLHFQDITDLRLLEHDARRRERLAAIGRLAASVAHEVRNPLAAMAGSAELIDIDSLIDEDQRLLKIIRREAVRLDRLVGDLLTFTAPHALQLIEVNLCTLMADTVESFRADPSSKKLEVSIAAPPELKGFVDPGAMTQILWNLLRNASVATKHEGTIHVRIFEHRDRRIIEIEDDGPGVAVDDRERVFEAFQSGGQGGFGFGLALVRRLVRDHGGEVTIHDREDEQEGARVRLSLPSLQPSLASGTFSLSRPSDSGP